jgi:hypothetical protein
LGGSSIPQRGERSETREDYLLLDRIRVGVWWQLGAIVRGAEVEG